MSQQTIGIGTNPNDGTGDPLRTAFNKANLNFTELYGLLLGTAAGAMLTLATATIGPPTNSTTALKITKADLTTAVMTFDTTNARVGINKTPGAFDLDVNGAVNHGGATTLGGVITSASEGATFQVSQSFGLDLAHARSGIGTGSTGVFSWSAGAASASPDTGLSRTGAATIAFGNGTAGDASANVYAGGFISNAGQIVLGATQAVEIIIKGGAGSVASVRQVGGTAIQFGDFDAAAPVAQTLRVQSVVAGTAAANGANWTFIGSLPTGTGTSGDIIFQTGVKTGSGTTQGTATTAMTIKGETQNVNFAGTTSALQVNSTQVHVAGSATAIPAGGSASVAYLATTTSGFGIYFGSGAPTVSAAKGSLYLRSDGSTTNDRAYINSNGSTTWTALTTAA